MPIVAFTADNTLVTADIATLFADATVYDTGGGGGPSGSGDASLENQLLILDLIADMQASLAAIEAKTGLITNGSVRTWPVVSAFGSIVNIASPVGQVAPITIPSDDYQALTLEVVWEEEGECLDGGAITNIATVANASITKAVDSITFAIPAAVAAQKQTLMYSVRDTVNGRLELIGGTWTVRPAAN